MDLSTCYLGLELSHPLLPGASPLATEIDSVLRLEDAGANAIVMNSLFEEQLAHDEAAMTFAVDRHEDSFAEASDYLPSGDAFWLGPDEYLDQIRRIRERTALLVIGSLNGTTLGGWVDYAKQIEEAGAAALELNLYSVPDMAEVPAASIEEESEAIVRELKQSIGIPIAVKLSPFYTSLPHFARRLDLTGADGLVLFNRFYQPDLDIEQLDVRPSLRLSDSHELRLRLRWIAMLSERVNASLAVTGGVHTAVDAIKSIMSGAHAVQIVSELLRHGPGRLSEVLADMTRWFEDHEYESLEQARGSLNLKRCPQPGAHERANYFQVLRSYRERAF